MIGRTLAHYEILSKLGSGGMGEVFAALDNKLNRKVALKVLHREMTEDRDRQTRFEREAMAVAALNHPNIVTIHAIDQADDVRYLTMELIEGRTLVDIISAGGLRLEPFFELAIPLTDAVSAAHAQSIIHRDLKPGNVMVTREGRIKVLDFGLAKLRRELDDPASSRSPTEALTQTGSLLGTVPYMSPEQLKGKQVDHRSDVFSLGVMLYEMVTGTYPFRGETSADCVSSILRDTPTPVTELKPDLPRHLGRIIRRCLEKDADRRYQVTADLRNELQDLQTEIGTGAQLAGPSPTAAPAPGSEAVAKLIQAATLDEVRATGCKVVHLEKHTVALFSHGEAIYAVDNRCPHMGFPLDRGSVKDCILTCHWHHARFDLSSGGTFDPWADDLRAFPVEIRGGEVWVDVARLDDPTAHQGVRVREGLEQNIPLVIAKAVVMLLEQGEGPSEALRVGLKFGARYRQWGWGQGLTILTCMMNLLPHLEEEDRPRALYHGLSAVASECDGMPPRFDLRPLPESPADVATLKRWLRQFVEVRDAQGAERCIVSAVRAGATDRQMADLLFAAATDHRYLEAGHVLDFINKALEALDAAGWDLAEPVLASLARGLATADRMEESNAWRHPVDLIPILERAFEALATALEIGQGRRGSWAGRDVLVDVLSGDDPQAIADALLMALRGGGTEDELAGGVAYAAALRIARFHVSNEFGDWDTALHTFTFANAVHQGLRRSPSPELMRGVFDAAMSIYLDRFLNVPATAIPEPQSDIADADALLAELPALLDRQQQVNQAGELVAKYQSGDHDPARLRSTMGRVLLREDRDFHTIQVVEAAVRQSELRRGTPAATHVLIAAARYLAAHAPTVRAQEQTYQIARRLHRGEQLHEAS